MFMVSREGILDEHSLRAGQLQLEESDERRQVASETGLVLTPEARSAFTKDCGFIECL